MLEHETYILRGINRFSSCSSDSEHGDEAFGGASDDNNDDSNNNDCFYTDHNNRSDSCSTKQCKN